MLLTLVCQPALGYWGFYWIELFKNLESWSPCPFGVADGQALRTQPHRSVGDEETAHFYTYGSDNIHNNLSVVQSIDALFFFMIL